MSLTLDRVLPRVRALAGAVVVVKLGGELLEKPRMRDAIAADVAALHRLGLRVVLVHGGGPQLDRAAQVAGLPAERIAGRRITSPELRDLAVVTWRGALQTEVVAAIARAGERAIGLCGADGAVLRAERRPPALVTDDSGKRVSVDFGEVGDLSSVDAVLLRGLLDLGVIPVLCPLALGADGSLLNVNADTVASAVAGALQARALLLATQAPGILVDPEDASSVLHWANPEKLDQLEAQGSLRGGMRPKVAAVRKALASGVQRVHIFDGRTPGAILSELLTVEGVGTLIEDRSSGDR